MITVYGIKNCDTCRKALKWLDGEGIEARFHDFRVDGLDGATLDSWLGAVGWETVLNRRGASWRAVPKDVQAAIDAASARRLILDNPTLVKRPVFDLGGNYLVGFKDAEKQAILSARS